MMRARWITLALGLWLCLPTTAHAFRDHLTFGLTSVEGGGGGRYFTGSRRDGYTCAVCHVDETPPVTTPSIAVVGLPEDGYGLDESYVLTVELPDAEGSSGAIEITDRFGAGVGTLTAAEAPAVEDLCTPVDTMPGSPGVFVVPLEARRMVAVANDCGVERLRVTWRAPAEPAGPVFVHAVVVAADGDILPPGDATAVLERQLQPAGADLDGPRVGTACAAGIPDGSGAPIGAALMALALLVARRSRA